MAKEPIDNTSAQLFKDLLKMKRREMKPWNRAKTKSPKITKQWLYPYQYERAYFQGIRKIQKQFTEPLTKVIADNLDRWIEEYRADSMIIKEGPQPGWKQDEMDAYDELVEKRENREDAFSTELAEIIEEINELLREIYGPDAPEVRTLITATGGNVSDWNEKQAQKFYKDLLGVEFIINEPWEEEVLGAWGDNNFELIKSLSTEYIKTVNDIVADGVQFGKTYDEIMREIRKKNKNITDARSRLIARDQVGKLNGALTKRRMEDAGIDMYTWMTAGDERVRGNPAGPFKNAVPSHFIMNNKLCRWDDNTVFSEDGGKTWKKRTGKMPRAIPGQEIQCRCTAIPFFDDMIAEIDEEIDEEIEKEEAA